MIFSYNFHLLFQFSTLLLFQYDREPIMALYEHYYKMDKKNGYRILLDYA